jgi:hypothetical protein
MKQVTVRSGEGENHRFTTLPASLIPLLEARMAIPSPCRADRANS